MGKKPLDVMKDKMELQMRQIMRSYEAEHPNERKPMIDFDELEERRR